MNNEFPTPRRGAQINITVRQFDEEGAKKALKECPKIVRDYVKLLIQHQENWKDIAQKAINKLRNPNV